MANQNTYNAAVSAVRNHSEAEQARLDAIASWTRVRTIEQLRALATSMDSSTPGYAICALVAQTIEVGRADGYPVISLPKETMAVVQAAWNSGILKSRTVGGLEFYLDGSGIAGEIQVIAADIAAWSAAANYRKMQTWKSL